MGLVVLPKSLTAHTEAKASDVMADFNAIVAQVNGKIDLENLAESIRNTLLPTGSIVATARASAPTGYLLCEGQAVSRTTYAILFAAIGTLYGAGDGVTTFNLPDLRGRVPVGVDGGTSRITIGPNTQGGAGGDQRLQFHTHPNAGGTSVESNTHTHAIPGFPGTRHEGEGFAYENWQDSAGHGYGTDTEGAFHTHALTGNTGGEGTGGSENLMPYQVVRWLIKT